jgi:two-component system sensor kinase FixL
MTREREYRGEACPSRFTSQRRMLGTEYGQHENMGTPLRVLIVEAAPERATLVLDALRDGGFEPNWECVETAASMRAALAGKTWDAVIAAYALPHFNGRAALQVVRELGLDVPFIVVSVARETAGVELMRAGANDYLGKHNLTRLPAALDRELREARERHERQRTEHSLRESEARARGLVDAAVDGIVTINEHGIIESFNPAAERLFGYTAREAIGQNIAVLMPPPFRDDHDQSIARYLRTGEKKIIGIGREVVGARKDGTTFAMDLAVSEVRLRDRQIFTGTVRDITERKRSEEALRESEMRFAQFMYHLPGVAFMKDATGHYLYVNEAFERFFHRKVGDYVGKTDDEVWPLEVAAELQENDQLVLRSGKVLQTTETIPHDDGLHQWLVTKFPILNDRGTPRIVAGVAIDISAAKRAEAQLRELQQVTQQRERLADIGAITAQIVHDLGNPLAGISMQAQLILRRAAGATNQPARALLKPAEIIFEEVRRLDSLIKEFMDFSREQRLDLKAVRLSHFLDQVLVLWQPVAAARDIGLALDMPEDVPPLSADADKLLRVFENLLKNAIEAIGHGPGRIVIRVVVPEAGRVVINVEDTGPGIPEGFDPFRLFETTKPQGTGLGLPIARQIVVAHGGHIDFGSREPRGTVFQVALPFGKPQR